MQHNTLTPMEYGKRRIALMEQLPPGSVVIISAAREIIRNADTEYRFRQDSNYFYLTGSNEPESWLVLDGEKSILFNRPRDPDSEQWTGRRLGQEGALEKLGMDLAFPVEDIAKELPRILMDKTAVYYHMNRDLLSQEQIFHALKTLKGMTRKGVRAPEALCDLEPILGEMRLIKSESELNLMRKAANISVEAHKHIMSRCREFKYEYELEAELMYTFLRHGCKSPAYYPIVGSGGNACILHYTDNDQPIDKKGLILVDAGGEYGNYAADITRTFPANGHFSNEQRAIYSLVLQAWKAGIACVKPNTPWNAIQQTIIRVLTEGLCDLGILKGDVETCIEKEAYRPFYMHNSGHWLGLDVHDTGMYKKDGHWRMLKPGMTLTVEPGLYISEMEGVDEKWWNLGVRIEDDILVTEHGHENLTADLPAEIDEIEALMRG